MASQPPHITLDIALGQVAIGKEYHLPRPDQDADLFLTVTRRRECAETIEFDILLTAVIGKPMADNQPLSPPPPTTVPQSSRSRKENHDG